MKRLYSSRLDWHTPPNRLAELRSRMPGYLDLTISNPTQAGIVYPEAEILDALHDPRALRYEPSPLGLESAREAVSEYYYNRGFQRVSPSRILLTASTSEAYSMLFKLLCDPGDEVLVPQPSYPLFEYLARLESVVPVPYQLFYDGRWSPDELWVNDRTKAVIAVSPNNPTGSLTNLLMLQRTERTLIIDEVFADYVDERPSYCDLPAFVLNGLSKIAGLPQLKLGWIVCPDRVAEPLELIADTYLSVSAPVQYALPKLLKLCWPVHAQIRDRCRANYQWLRARLANAPATVLNIDGGWTAPIEIPRTRTEEDFVCELLEHHGVFVQPGYFYDFPREAYIVVSLLTPPEIFQEGIHRFANALC